MKQLANIEFFNTPEGGVMVRDAEGVRTYNPEDKEVSGVMFGRIESEYPKAFRALSELYCKSVANPQYFRYLCCHRFIRCNWGQLDSRVDVDGLGRFTFEEVSCPIRCECKYAGVICNPEFNTTLTDREKEVVKLLAEGNSIQEVAEMLYISPLTAETHKKNGMRRIGAKTLAEYVIWANKNL